MKKQIRLMTYSILLLILITLVIIFLNNPPLSYNGLTNEMDKKSIIIEVKNTGFTKLNIKEVIINHTEQPNQLKLGVSHSNHLVAGGMLDEDPHILFLNINEHSIYPALSAEEQIKLNTLNDFSKPRHYGIRVQYNNAVEHVTIKYTYFFIPFTLDVEIPPTWWTLFE